MSCLSDDEEFPRPTSPIHKVALASIFTCTAVRTVDLTFTVAYKTLRSTSTPFTIGWCPNFRANKLTAIRAFTSISYTSYGSSFLRNSGCTGVVGGYSGGSDGGCCRLVKDASLITVTGI
ncbi:hypothetical protein CBL_00462 [Carabus blaptoides fortunei]